MLREMTLMSMIKIKVKHLLLIIVLIPVLLFILPYGYLFYADKISEKNPAAAVTMYKKYIAAPPFVLRKDHALFSLALKSFYAKGGSYYEKISTDGMAQLSSYISKKMLDTTVSLYKDLLKNYKNSNYYLKAYNNLLYVYTYSANTKAGLELIREGQSSDKKSVRLVAARYKLYYKLAEKQYSEVLKLGKEFIKEYGKDCIVYKLMAEASLFTKDFESTINDYNNAKVSLVQKFDDTVYTLFQDSYYEQQISLVEDLKENGAKNTSVSGRVSVLGKGVPFARVYLKDITDNGMYSGDECVPTFGITDFNGNYTIKGAPIGNYKLLIDIPGFLINDSVLSETSASNITLEDVSSIVYDFNFVKPLKLNIGLCLKPDKGHVKLSWEKVSGAVYYTINAILFHNPLKPDGNSSGVQISEAIATESYNLDLATVNIKSTSYTISDNGVLNPQAYLGTFYPGCSVPIYINAYDENGLQLTSSMSKIVRYDKLPVIALSNKDLGEVWGLPKGLSSSAGVVLTRAEGLILEGKPEQAEKILSAELKKSPDNIWIMNILSNIYSLGTRIVLNPSAANKSTESDKTSEASDFGKKVIGQNLQQAIGLNHKLYALSGDAEYIRKNYFIYAFELKDYSGLVKNYDRIAEAKFTGYDYDNRGEAKLMLGNFEEAAKDFDKMYRSFKYNQATNLNPILLDLYNKNFKGALTAIDKTNLRLYKVSVTQLKKDITAIQSTSISNGEYESFKKVLKRIMQKKSNSTRQSAYKDLIEKIQNTQLNSIIRQAMSYHGIYE
jgi:hypothetical protein